MLLSIWLVRLKATAQTRKSQQVSFYLVGTFIILNIGEGLINSTALLENST